MAFEIREFSIGWSSGMPNLPIIFLIASGGLFFGYINPTYTKDTGSSKWEEKSVKELRFDEQEYKEALETKAQIERIQNDLLKKYNNLSKQRDRMAKLLPEHIDTVRLIIDINTLAGDYGMALKNISLEEKTDTKNSKNSIGPNDKRYDSLDLSFSVTGSYDDFLNYLSNLEESLRIVDIISVSFTAGVDSAYEYKVKLRTYKMKS